MANVELPASKKPKMDFSYENTHMYVLAIIGIIIKLFLSSSTSDNGETGPASGTIWGYSIVACAVIGIMILTFASDSANVQPGSVAEKSLNMATTKNSFSFIINMILKSLTPVLLLAILSWLIVLNSIYFKQINEGKYASEYTTYNHLSTFLVLIQLALLIQVMTSDKKDKKIQMLYQALTYLVSIGNISVIIIITIILKYFSTDGFIG